MSDDHLSVAQSIIDEHINELIRPHFILCTEPGDGKEVRDDQAGGGACFSRNRVVDFQDGEDEDDVFREALETDSLSPSDPVSKVAGVTLPKLVFDETIDRTAECNVIRMRLSFHIHGNRSDSAAYIDLYYDVDVKLLYIWFSKTREPYMKLGLNRLLRQAVALISIASEKRVALEAVSKFTVLAAIDTGFVFDTKCSYPISKETESNIDGTVQVTPQYLPQEDCYKHWPGAGEIIDLNPKAILLNTLIEKARNMNVLHLRRRERGNPLESSELLKFLHDYMHMREPTPSNRGQVCSVLPMIFDPESTPLQFVLNNIATQSSAVSGKIQANLVATGQHLLRGPVSSLHDVPKLATPQLPPLIRPPLSLPGETTSVGGGSGATLSLAFFASAAVLVVSTLVGSSR
jgi:hypothetical protein